MPRLFCQPQTSLPQTSQPQSSRPQSSQPQTSSSVSRAALSLVLALAALLLTPTLAQANGERSGRRAPGFALPDGNLNYHDLYDLRGRVVLIEIMQTGCPNCKATALNLERVKKKYGNRVATLTIINPPDNQQTVRQFMFDNNISSPMLFDCGQVTASYLMLTPQNPTIHVPHLFLVDKDGMIRNDFAHSEENRNILEKDGLDAEIDKLLASSPRQSKTPPANRRGATAK